jgi:hypothetical protein
MKKRLTMIGLTIACLFTGYGFYRMNNGDEPILAAIFTFGILGIMLSVARNMKSE